MRNKIVGAVVLSIVAAILCWQLYTHSTTQTQVQPPLQQIATALNITPEIGQAIDSLHGVKVYYNGSVSHVLGRNLTADHYNLGLKYQCVEFVKRYYYEHFHHKMPDSYGHAKDFFDPKTKDGSLNKRRDLLQFSNPSKAEPQVGDLLVLDGNEGNPFGHVVIVAAVLDGAIEIIQQNPGILGSSREKWALYPLAGGKWKIDQSGLLGWLRLK